MIAAICLSPLFAAALICVWSWRWHWLWRTAAAAGLMAGGVALFLMISDRYLSPARVTPLDVPLDLNRAGPVISPAFRPAFTDTFYVDLVTDHATARQFFCLMGADANILTVTQCGNRDPELNIAWVARERGRMAGSGANAFALWHRIATAPTPTELDLIKHGAGHLPADAVPGMPDRRASPSQVQLGWFSAERGHAYRLEISLAAPAPTLAKLHPRLRVQLNPMVGKGLPLFFLMFLMASLSGGIAIMLSNLLHHPRVVPA